MGFMSSENIQLGIKFSVFCVRVGKTQCLVFLFFPSFSSFPHACADCELVTAYSSLHVLIHIAVLHHCSHFIDGAAGSSVEHRLKFAENGDDMDATQESGQHPAAA